MVFMPQEVHGKERKLALPYHGLYQILEVCANCLLLRPIDCPDDPPVLLRMDRVVDCPSELPDMSWLGPRRKRRKRQRRARQEPGTPRPNVMCKNVDCF